MRSQAANAPAGQLDVATISAHLHTNLQQSAFTDAAGAHAAGSADIPASPFTVNSGRSAWQEIMQPQQNKGMTIRVPVHNMATCQRVPANVALPEYRYNAWDPLNPLPNMINISEDPSGVAATLQDFRRNFEDYIYPGLQFPGGQVNPVIVTQMLRTILSLQQQKDIIKALFYNQSTFSQGITIKELKGGEVLVRCCERGTRASEPGRFWSPITEMPLSIIDVRDSTAVLPNWNQNGNLEFFVVPELSHIIILEGCVASQALMERNSRYYQIGIGGHFRCNGPNPEFLDDQNRPTRHGQNVNGQYLLGGSIQVVITGNPINGSCIAIIETGFDVEMLP